jgi:hypothetical protein
MIWVLMIAALDCACPPGIGINIPGDETLKVVASYTTETACKKVIDQIWLDEIHAGKQPDGQHRCVQIKLP